MLNKKEKGIMFYIIKHCKRVEEKIKGVDRKQFDNSEDIREIICFNIFQIGELVKQLPPEFLSTYNKMPWKDIKGMRDYVGHGYGTIEFDIVWKTATQDVKPLREYCESILSGK